MANHIRNLHLIYRNKTNSLDNIITASGIGRNHSDLFVPQVKQRKRNGDTWFRWCKKQNGSTWVHKLHTLNDCSWCPCTDNDKIGKVSVICVFYLFFSCLF